MTDAMPQITDETEDRPTKPALRRGWQRCCPNCGEGRLFTGYLTVAATCTACGESFVAQRADDGPAYLTILIVGHVMAPLFLWSYFRWQPSPLVMSVVFTAGTVALSLYLLPRLKGALVALQWAKRMHGFGKVTGPVV
ncbi:MAG: DUF983 domain-containing protein [Rhodobacteraceae bacterium]|jgi:uncharacterized protein (DUF983 family)|nr:DUF983 domain-containing protein [Paracoccaceae bacterium]